MTFRENNREEFTLYMQKQYYVAKTQNMNNFYFTLIVPYIILVHNLKPETLKSLYITLYNFIHIQHWGKKKLAEYLAPKLPVCPVLEKLRGFIMLNWVATK